MENQGIKLATSMTSKQQIITVQSKQHSDRIYSRWLTMLDHVGNDTTIPSPVTYDTSCHLFKYRQKDIPATCMCTYFWTQDYAISLSLSPLVCLLLSLNSSGPLLATKWHWPMWMFFLEVFKSSHQKTRVKHEMNDEPPMYLPKQIPVRYLMVLHIVSL